MTGELTPFKLTPPRALPHDREHRLCGASPSLALYRDKGVLPANPRRPRLPGVPVDHHPDRVSVFPARQRRAATRVGGHDGARAGGGGSRR